MCGKKQTCFGKNVFSLQPDLFLQDFLVFVGLRKISVVVVELRHYVIQVWKVWLETLKNIRVEVTISTSLELWGFGVLDYI